MTPRHPPRALSSLTYIKAHAQSRYILKYQLQQYSVFNVHLSQFRKRSSSHLNRGATVVAIPAKPPAGRVLWKEPLPPEPSLFVSAAVSKRHKNRPDAQADPFGRSNRICVNYRAVLRAVSFKLRRLLYLVKLAGRKPCIHFLVEPRRFELLTLCMQSRCSPS